MSCAVLPEFLNDRRPPAVSENSQEVKSLLGLLHQLDSVCTPDQVLCDVVSQEAKVRLLAALTN